MEQELDGHADAGKVSHTPGPWAVREDGAIEAHDLEEPDVPWVVAATNMGCGWPSCQDDANARLIAAAPCMAAELRRMAEKLASAEAGFGPAEEALGGPLTDDDAVTITIGELRAMRDVYVRATDTSNDQ